MTCYSSRFAFRYHLAFMKVGPFGLALNNTNRRLISAKEHYITSPK
jgi:hypothetical protein